MVSLELLFFMMNDTIFFDTIVKSILQSLFKQISTDPKIYKIIL